MSGFVKAKNVDEGLRAYGWELKPQGLKKKKGQHKVYRNEAAAGDFVRACTAGDPGETSKLAMLNKLNRQIHEQQSEPPRDDNGKAAVARLEKREVFLLKQCEEEISSLLGTLDDREAHILVLEADETLRDSERRAWRDEREQLVTAEAEARTADPTNAALLKAQTELQVTREELQASRDSLAKTRQTAEVGERERTKLTNQLSRETRKAAQLPEAERALNAATEDARVWRERHNQHQALLESLGVTFVDETDIPAFLEAQRRNEALFAAFKPAREEVDFRFKLLENVRKDCKDAQHYLAGLHLLGAKGFEKDAAERARLLKLSAAQGHRKAIEELALGDDAFLQVIRTLADRRAAPESS